MIRLMTAAALALLTACAAQPRAEAHTDAPPSDGRVLVAEHGRSSSTSYVSPAVTCDIRATRTAQGLRVEAIAHASREVRGEYEFALTAQGRGGSSDITQGGPFDVAAGRSATIGSAEISRGRFRAVLTLRDADGELCHLERQS